jgi:hypothetical protein
MKRLLLALSLVALTAAVQPAIRLKPTTITLPADYEVEYPAGPDVDAANTIAAPAIRHRWRSTSRPSRARNGTRKCAR